ncbi:MAG: hypothetical protein JW876_02280 [Candidatus Krumholzibacteriota bacterium]|nr:hypothetical protein [Candidatus Krumholzibacteriota bacterium]
MLKRYRLLAVVAVAALLLGIAGAVSAQNILANPGFEDGLNGWQVFGNAYAETTNPDAGFIPYEGDGLASIFGNWWGVFNVTGIFQEFPTTAGAEWTMSCKSRHWGGDPMIGVGAPDANWVVQKIAWFNALGEEIGGVESTILDGTFATDTWFDNAPIVGVAPEGTVKLQALVLYLQPLWDGGACHVDNAVLYQSGGPVGTDDASWSSIKAAE